MWIPLQSHFTAFTRRLGLVVRSSE